MKYLNYLRYLVRHKYYVGIECFKRGLIWLGIIHDLSKFSHHEFTQYADKFYGDKDPDGNSSLAVELRFDLAFHHHVHNNPHHWEYWLKYSKKSGVIFPYRMPEKYVQEMIADWVGTGKSINGRKKGGMEETRKWYLDNRKYMKLHPDTERRVEELIDLPKKQRYMSS
jgi:hypothetical protein